MKLQSNMLVPKPCDSNVRVVYTSFCTTRETGYETG